MKLPAHPEGGVQIGISDILAWRDCAARAKVGRRRLEGNESPETQSPQAAYGSAIHLCLQMLDDGATLDDALQAALAEFKQWLEPSDLSRLTEDIEKYLAREILGVTTLLNEGEISVPLFEHPVAGKVWFRARIDRLYQSVTQPGHLIHVDYKSSKHAKSEEEVRKDLQLWSYNWSIYEWFTYLYPEVEPVHLEQVYDQLNYGQIRASKGPDQRAEIKRWLIAAVTAMIEDEDELPTWNEWCAWCSLKMDCPVVQYQLTDWATAKIAALMPREEKLKKDGTPSKRQGRVVLDPERLGEYVELLPQVKRAAQVLKAFDEELTGTLREMPDSDLHLLGRKKTQRSKRVFSSEAKREIIELVGLPQFLMLCELSIAQVERFFEGEKEIAAQVTALAERQGSYTVIEKI